MMQSDIHEIEEKIRNILLTPYNKGSISILTEDIEISQIREFKKKRGGEPSPENLLILISFSNISLFQCRLSAMQKCAKP